MRDDAETRERFAELLTGLAASFGVETNKALLRGYWVGLSDLDMVQLEQAAARALRDLTWFPRPVELRRLAGSMSAEDRAVRAWTAVRRAIQSHGAYRSVDFDDPLVNATIRSMGGWLRICSLPVEEWEVWGRKEFDRVYCSFMRGGATAEGCAYLVGKHEQDNAGLDCGDKLLTDGPVRVLVGLPVHDRHVLRHLGPVGGIRLLKGGE